MGKAYQKELDIFEKLNAMNYSLFGDESVDPHTRWVAAVDYVSKRTNSITKYMNAIAKREHGLATLKYCPIPEDDPDFIIRSQNMLYSEATIALQTMRTSLGELNTLSEKLGLEPFANIDINDIHAVGEFAKDYMNDIFLEGHEKLTKVYENKKVIKPNMALRTSDISEFAISPDNPHKEANDIVEVPSSI